MAVAAAGGRLRGGVLDAIRAKVRDEGLVENKAVYLGIGVTCAGRKEVLGLWIEQTEGARFWFAVMNELKACGLRDVLIAVVDGLNGFAEASSRRIRRRRFRRASCT